MYTKGHVGISLIAYAPFGFGLLDAGYGTAAFAGGAVMLALSMLPDCDNHLPVLDHRGPTHSLLFAVLVGAVLGVAAAIVVPGDSRTAASVLAFAVGTVSVLAHLAGDVITPKGVAPFWPLSRRRYSLQITPARDPVANDLLLGVGVLVTAAGLLLVGMPG